MARCTHRRSSSRRWATRPGCPRRWTKRRGCRSSGSTWTPTGSGWPRPASGNCDCRATTGRWNWGCGRRPDPGSPSPTAAPENVPHPPDDCSRITGCKDAAVARDAVICRDSTPGRESAKPSPAGAPPSTRRWLCHYDDGVPVEIRVPRSLPDLLDTAADRWPGSAAICYRGRATTFRELRREVELLATALARLSVRRGDRVALVLPTCPQLVIGLHAVLRL